jgi:ribosome-binding ATPase YchF (GTP1/OBG family)
MNTIAAITEVFRGIGVKEDHVRLALAQNNLTETIFDKFGIQESKDFCWSLREISKPTLIVANKVDLPTATENFKRLHEEYRDVIIIPASADAELTLRRAESKGIIRYIPGEDILGEYMRTGVQFAINVAVFKLLKMNAVYPVADIQKLSDKHGNVLPDVYLMRSGSTVEDLAKEIHTELAKGVIYALDGRDGIRLPVNYHLKDRDVLSIVSARTKKK